MPATKRINKIDKYVRKLNQTEDKWVSLAIAVGIADEFMKGILPDKHGFYEQLDHYDEKEPKLPEPLSMDIFRTQKQETWFAAHPTLGSARVALNHFSDEESPLESHLFLLSDKNTKQKVSATTQFVSNWEDSDLTRNENYKVAIDFILTRDTNTLMVVLTNRQKLRVMELNGSLSNTQKQILADKLFTIPYIEDDKEKSIQELMHKSLWNAFHLKEVNDKFYQGISELHHTLVDYLQEENDISLDNSKQFSSRLLGRLLFIWFLREMNLINEKIGYFETVGLNATEYYETYLKALFFKILNTEIDEREVIIKDIKTPYLNGGLFDIKENDYYYQKIYFPENYFDRLYSHFDEFNFTVDESSVDYELVAVDPEMLGQIFESLLASHDDEETSDRKKTGSFYTPRHIVDYMSKESIRQYLYREINNKKYEKGIDSLIDMTDAKFVEKKSSSTMDLWGTNTKTVVSEIKKALDKVKIIDPAVGSGAFPMGILQVMSTLYERLTPITKYNSYKTKLHIIENNIYGVDIQPMAVEISRLRAWLAIIVDDYHDNQKVNPLPNLEFKFVSANSLVELETQGEIWADPELENELAKIRSKYFNARTKKSKEKWEKDYYKITNQAELFEDKRSQQLKSFDPFNNMSTASFFDSEVMFGVSNGFDIVVGNPPYIHFQRLEKENREFYKNLKYETYAARGDIYTLFYELGIKLLNTHGILSYITSNKWLRSSYGKKLRNFIIKNVDPLILINLGEGIFEHATVDTSILILKNKSYTNHKTLSLSLNEGTIEEGLKNEAIFMKYEPNEIWRILNPIEQSIKEKIEKIGTPLKEWDINIRRGVVTTLNPAFIISEDKKEELVKEDSKSAEIIRPLLRGRDIQGKSHNFAFKYLINTHNGYVDDKGRNINKIDINDYPAVKRHLDSFEPRLSKRSDQGDTPYNLRSMSYMNEYNKEKIIYPETTQTASFYLDKNKFMIDQTAFMITGKNDLEYLQFTLASELFEYAYKHIFSVVQLGKKAYQYNKYGLEKLPVLKNISNLKLASEEDIYQLYNLSKAEIKYIKQKV